MNLRDFKETIEFNIEHDIKHAILGLGPPGLGKSQVIHQVGDKYGYKVIDIRLAQMSEVEIGGLIYPNEDKTKTRWLSPEILPDVERDGEKTILLLDEITSCPKRVQVAAYQLILDRRVGQYQLPEGTFVIALGNREDDDGVYIHLAGPLADRFEIHTIDVDFDTWKWDYAMKAGIHSYVMDYLTFKPAALHTQDPESGNMVFATPRSWERVSDILTIDKDISKPVIRNKIIGNIGMEEALQFMEFVKSNDRHVSAQDFIDGRATQPEAPEEIAILVDGIVAGAKFIVNYQGSSDLTDVDLWKIKKIIRALFRLSKAEFTILGMSKLMEMNRIVVKEVFYAMDDPVIIEFVKKHPLA